MPAAFHESVVLREPDEPKAYLFAKIYHAGCRLIPAPIRRCFVSIFGTISPSVPISLTKFFRNDNKKIFFAQSFLLTFLFCFGANLVLTWLFGTLSGSQPDRMYYAKDWYNLVQYTILTPTYVACALSIILVTIEGWASLRDFATDMSGGKIEPFRKNGGALLVFTLLAMCTALIINFIFDILDARNVKAIYWFADVQPNGSRTLNAVGVYYVVMNCALLIIATAAVCAFFSLFFEVMRIGYALSIGNPNNKLTLAQFKTALAPFTLAYLFAKIMVAACMLLFYFWKASPLGATRNVLVALVVLTLVGLFFVSFPRYFVELQWHYYKQCQQALVSKDSPNASTTDNLNFDDTRPLQIRIVAHIVDTLIIGGFLFSAWSDYF